MEFLGYPLEIERIAFLREIKLQVFLNGTIRVFAGKLLGHKQIIHFLEDHREWIESAQEKHQQIRSQYPEKKFAEGELFPYFGNNKPLKIEVGNFKKLKFSFKEDLLLCQQPPNSSFNKSEYRKALLKCYEQAGRKWLIHRVSYWSAQMNLHPKKLTFRSQKTRWGSCSSQGTISLNWRLLAAPLPVMDYVVIHELAHLKHPNHSKAFWSLVKQYDVNYKYHRKWLRQHQWAFDFLSAKSELHRDLND